MTKQKVRMFYPVLAILIPCILGALAMKNNDLVPRMWVLSFLFMLPATVICFFLSKIKFKFNYKAIAIASIILLRLTFYGPMAGDANRWIRIFGISINVATLVLPILLVSFARLLEEKQVVLALGGIAVTADILLSQPDASQLLAFSVPCILLLLKSDLSKIVKGIFSVGLAFLTMMSWNSMNILSPVNHTEGILAMLGEMSGLLCIIGILSLFGVPVYFLICGHKDIKWICLGIALYYWLMILSSFIGDFPVPFMGYGLSTIMGYYVFLVWFLNESKQKSMEEG